MDTGQVVRANILTVLCGQPNWNDRRDTWKTKKGFRFVLLVLGTESDDAELDPHDALKKMGFVKTKCRGTKPSTRKTGSKS